MWRADLDHVRNRRFPVVTGQPDAAGIHDHSPIPQMDHSRNMTVSAEDDPGVDAFGPGLDNSDRARSDITFRRHVIEPKSSIVPRRPMAEEDLFSIHERGRHAGHPVEVLTLELPKIAPIGAAHLPEF